MQLELGAVDNPLALPDRVRVISLWSRWAAAVAAGAKTIETRRWSWKGGPAWLAIHAGLTFDRLGGFGETEADRHSPWPTVPDVQPGALCALVRVTGCRRLVLEDKPAALLYLPNCYAWTLDQIHRLAPVSMRGPQRFSSVPQSVILDALARGAS